MRIKFQHIYLIILFLVTFSCQDGNKLVLLLDKAEGMMQERPDSSLTLLKKVKLKDFRKEVNRARYSLLYTQASDENHIKLKNDSLIRIAVDYYKNSGNIHQEFLSIFYRGRIQANDGKYVKAILSYIEAEQLVENINDGYSAGLLYTSMGDIYKLYFDYPESLKSYQKAVKYYSEAGKILHKLYAQRDVSAIYQVINNYEEGERILRNVLSEALQTGNHTLAKYCLADLIMQYVEQGKTEEAQKMYDEFTKNYNQIDNMSSEFISSISQLYASENDIEKARFYIERARKNAKTTNDSIIVHYMAAKSNQIIKNYKQAYYDLEQSIKLHNQIICGTLQQPVLTAERDFLSNELELQSYKLNMEKRFRIIYIVLSIFIALSLVFYLRKRIKQKDETIRQYLMTISELQETMRIGNTQMSTLIQQLFKDQFKLIDRFGSIFYGDSNDTTKRREAYKEAEILIDKFRNDKKNYSKLEDLVNRCNSNVMELLRTEIALPKESNYQQLCYHFAGFSVNVISVFMQDKTDNIYKRRSRFRTKISSSDAPHKELMLRLLGNS